MANNKFEKKNHKYEIKIAFNPQKLENFYVTQKYSESSSMALSDIIQDFENLLENGDPYDVIIKSSDDPLKEFKAHSTILRARAPYFSTALDTNKIQDGVHYFEESSIHSTVWPVILRYLYTGQFDFNEQQFSELKNLLEAADQLGLEKLMDSIKLPPKETINGNGTNTAKIGRVIKEKHDKAIYCYNNGGPCWGSKDVRSGLDWSVFPGIIYEDIGFSNYFEDEDYEVFQVIPANY
ncbi:unnamed protein product [Rhizophagus irregularis]|uniref:BTB domain-containing protein n=1 Tax=Rhizophagus irregularis TaxID=588596 RepID=A0A915ZL17_9GLOM|nr:unnamed protein product [Rhizophagus irregularis]